MSRVSKVSRLIKVPHEDVLVVGHRNDCLEDELALPDNDGLASAVVSVLPLDAIVDFMDADGVWSRCRTAVSVDNAPIQVFDQTETATAHCSRKALVRGCTSGISINALACWNDSR